MNQQQIAAYYLLIHRLLESSIGEEMQILNKHSELLDPGLLKAVITVAPYFENTGQLNNTQFLTDLGTI